MQHYFLRPAADLYSSPWDVPGGAVSDKQNLMDTHCQVIYDMYDRLVEQHPAQVSKKTLGQVFGLDFNQYTFRPLPLENRSDLPVKPLKLCIVTSLHGHEQACSWTAAHFFRLMYADKTDPVLAFLRRNVIFEVIPVANPWGFTNNQRKNANGIDLNRNFQEYFIYGGDPEGKYYGGAAPCTEQEIRLLMDFIAENMDAAAVLDYHNIGKGYPLIYAYQEKDTALAHSVFATLTDKWVQEYPQFPTDRILGRIRPNGQEGMFADHLLAKGLWAITLETPWCMPDVGAEKYDAATIRCALDVLANTIYAIVSNVD